MTAGEGAPTSILVLTTILHGTVIIGLLIAMMNVHWIAVVITLAVTPEVRIMAVDLLEGASIVILEVGMEAPGTMGAAVDMTMTVTAEIIHPKSALSPMSRALLLYLSQPLHGGLAEDGGPTSTNQHGSCKRNKAKVLRECQETKMASPLQALLQHLLQE